MTIPPSGRLTVSPKFQIVIPKALREALGIRPGQKMQAFVYKGRLELVPILPARRLRGIARGIDTRVARDRDRV